MQPDFKNDLEMKIDINLIEFCGYPLDGFK